MILSGSRIIEEIESGVVAIKPFRKDRIRAASYVLTLGGRFRRWKTSDAPLKVLSRDAASVFLDDAEELTEVVVEPAEFLLAHTTERIGLSETLLGLLFPLSHLARFGISIHAGANSVSPGFGSRRPTQLAIEIYNQNRMPVVLTSGMPLAHIRFAEIVAPDMSANRTSVYEGIDPLTAPKLFEEWNLVDK